MARPAYGDPRSPKHKELMTALDLAKKQSQAHGLSGDRPTDQRLTEIRGAILSGTYDKASRLLKDMRNFFDKRLESRGKRS